uniref:Uncharacterized protein n=1 Tax=Glossina pallidipes TaxID=7398 RepID=A0A1A9ZFR0_GLOPL
MQYGMYSRLWRWNELSCTTFSASPQFSSLPRNGSEFLSPFVAEALLMEEKDVRTDQRGRPQLTIGNCVIIVNNLILSLAASNILPSVRKYRKNIIFLNSTDNDKSVTRVIKAHYNRLQPNLGREKNFLWSNMGIALIFIGQANLPEKERRSANADADADADADAAAIS